MKWAIRISNSYARLSREEITTLASTQSVKWLHQLVGIINCSKNRLVKIVEKSASVKIVIQNPHIIDTRTLQDTLFDHIQNLPIDPPRPLASFAVRCYPIMRAKRVISTQEIERKLGSVILDRYRIPVDLDQPEMEFSCVIFDDTFVIGWKYREISFSKITANAPKNSPFFGGGSMKPMLSKLLVNLLYPQDAVIIDPFCGHGGILREIARLQSFAVGIEVDSKIARECKINNIYHSLDSCSNIVLGDATKMPLRVSAFEMVVTDPPYAKQTTTMGRRRDKLIVDFLNSLDTKKKLIMTLPDDLNMEIPKDWQVTYEEKDYVHKSLTRIVRRMEKNC